MRLKSSLDERTISGLPLILYQPSENYVEYESFHETSYSLSSISLDMISLKFYKITSYIIKLQLCNIRSCIREWFWEVLTPYFQNFFIYSVYFLISFLFPFFFVFIVTFTFLLLCLLFSFFL